MKSTREILTHTELFTGLKDQALAAIEAIVHRKNYSRDSFVFFESDPVTGFYIIITGRAQALKYSPSGRELIIKSFVAGDVAAESCLFDDHYPVSLQAATELAVLLVPKKDFIARVTADPAIALELITVLSRRNRYLISMIEDLSLREFPARLAKYLIDQAVHQHHTVADKLTLAIPVPKQQLASALGTIPETLSRTLKKLEKKKIIRSLRQQVVLLDCDRLHQVAAGEKL